MTIFTSVSSQQLTDIHVSGKIVDAITKKPVKASIVFTYFPEASEVFIVETDDSTGVYEAIIHREHKYVIEVSASYYKPEIDTFYLTSGREQIDFSLMSVNPGSLLRLHNIYFKQGDFQILENSYQELSELVLLMTQYPDMIIQLEGHTDRLGGFDANMELSGKRVEAMKEYLLDKGISGKRIKTKAFGETKPISTENTDESRRLNRRVEVRILKI